MMQRLIRKLQRLNWSIRYKIGLAFALVLLCFVVNGVVSILLLLNIRDTSASQQTIALELQNAQQYEINYNNGLETFADAIFFNNTVNIEDTFSNAIIQGVLDAGNNGSASAKVFADQFTPQYSIVLNDISALKILARSSDFDQARLKWGQFQPDLTKVSAMLKQRRQDLEQARTLSDQNITNTIWLSIGLIIGVAALSIILALLLLLLIERVIIRPLGKLQKALAAVAERDLQQEVEIYNQDEVGKLAQSFKLAIFTLQQVLKSVQISNTLGTVAQQLAKVSREQTVGSTEQLTALTQVTGAMAELSDTASQIAGSAAQVAGLTQTTLQQIEQVVQAGELSQQQAMQMIEVVENTLKRVEHVEVEMANFSQRMYEFNTQAHTVNKIVSLVSNIAGEVHLLSLNAAIEAAGAGEYGDRFKVIAREIKQLANRVNRTNEEAQRLIRDVQDSSQEALVQFQAGQTEIEEVVQANSYLRQHLHQLEESNIHVKEAVFYLLSLVGQVSEQAESIKQITYQQHLSNTQILASAQSANHVTEENVITNQQINASSIQLETLTLQLDSVLSQIKLAV